jgi:hypothetical protein
MLDSALLAYLDGLHVALDPAARFERVIGPADDWQRDFLSSTSEFALVLCSRQVGKSTSTACLAWAAMSLGQMVLIVAPSARQSMELLRKIVDFKNADPTAPRVIRSTLTELELANGGRVLCAPASSDTIRGFTVDLLIVEEAAFVLDDVITAILPMRKEGGRVVMISTPAGRQGIFYDLWQGGKVHRIFARSVDIPRLAAKVDFDRRFMPLLKFRTEHLCEFLGSGTPAFDPLSLEAAISPHAKALVL